MEELCEAAGQGGSSCHMLQPPGLLLIDCTQNDHLHVRKSHAEHYYGIGIKSFLHMTGRTIERRASSIGLKEC
jgi:hypothetical protein